MPDDPMLKPLIDLQDDRSLSWPERLERAREGARLADAQHPDSVYRVCWHHEVIKSLLNVDDVGAGQQVLGMINTWPVGELRRPHCGACLLGSCFDALIALGRHTEASALTDAIDRYIEARFEPGQVTTLTQQAFADWRRLLLAALTADGAQADALEASHRDRWMRLVRSFEATREAPDAPPEVIAWCDASLTHARESMAQGAIVAALARGEHQQALDHLADYRQAFDEESAEMTRLMHIVITCLRAARAWAPLEALAPQVEARCRAGGHWRWLADLLIARAEGALARDEPAVAHDHLAALEPLEAQLAPGSLTPDLERLRAAL